MDNLVPEIQEVFRGVFDQPNLLITRGLNAANVSGWDSLAHMQLLTALEMKYKIHFALGELEDLKNVGDLLDLIETKLSKKMKAHPSR
jgi:acyl carrier protein